MPEWKMHGRRCKRHAMTKAHSLDPLHFSENFWWGRHIVVSGTNHGACR